MTSFLPCRRHVPAIAPAVLLALTLAACDAGLTETTTTADGLLTDAQEEKVELCHYSADDDAYYYINVSGNALEAHLEHHGDVPYGNESNEMLCQPEPEGVCTLPQWDQVAAALDTPCVQNITFALVQCNPEGPSGDGDVAYYSVGQQAPEEFPIGLNFLLNDNYPDGLQVSLLLEACGGLLVDYVVEPRPSLESLAPCIHDLDTWLGTSCLATE